MDDDKKKDRWSNEPWWFRYVWMCKSMFEGLMRLVGPLFVLLASGLVVFIMVIHFKGLIPLHTTYSSVSGTLHLIASSFIAFNLLFNFYNIVFTKPGFTSDIPSLEENMSQDQEGVKRDASGKKFKFCKSCKKPKPPRSHHCHICKRCVLRMDHHCPWVSNCVGHYNHKYFVLFLFYLWAGCAYVATMSWSPFLTSANYKTPWTIPIARPTIVFTFVITIAIFLAITFMLSWHTYLIFTGQTTIEFYANRFQQSTAKERGEPWENIYDLGLYKNFQLFFGTTQRHWITWLLPNLKPTPGDGVAWPIRSTYRQDYSV